MYYCHQKKMHKKLTSCYSLSWRGSPSVFAIYFMKTSPCSLDRLVRHGRWHRPLQSLLKWLKVFVSIRFRAQHGALPDQPLVNSKSAAIHWNSVWANHCVPLSGRREFSELCCDRSSSTCHKHRRSSSNVRYPSIGSFQLYVSNRQL